MTMGIYLNHTIAVASFSTWVWHIHHDVRIVLWRVRYMNNWEEESVGRIFPSQIRQALAALPTLMHRELEEIRLRNGNVAAIRIKTEELPLLCNGQPIAVTEDMLEQVLELAHFTNAQHCKASTYQTA